MAKISEQKLARYRELGSTTLTEISDTEIRALLDRMEAEGCSAFSPMFDIASAHWGFFRAPYSRDLEGVDIACVGVPLESSVPAYSGTRYGPQAVRKWSHRHGPVHHLSKTMPFEICSIIEYGDIEFTTFDHTRHLDDIHEAYSRMKDANVVPLSIGGEHTITYPILKALGRDEPLGLIHIDAHADTTGPFVEHDDVVFDGNLFRVAVMDGLIDPERTIQVGIRGFATLLWEFSHDTGMRVVTAEELQEKGVKAIIEEAQKIIGDGPCYLTLDVDGIDPAHMPGTGLPEPFGLTSREVRDFIRGLDGLDLVGADITEICPARDVHGISANLGSALMFEMLCLLSEARLRRTGKARKTHWSRAQT